jgi:tRNA(Ile)-lysidine synthetase-like protein
VHRGGTLERGALARLSEPIARRALARLLAEATGDVPHRAALDRLVADLFAGRTGWHQIAGGWRLQLRADRIDLEPPPRANGRASTRDARQLELPFDPVPAAEGWPDGGLELVPPGRVALPDGRRITADLVAPRSLDDVSRSPLVAELDARDLPLPLVVRRPRPGDRFHPIGAPGAKTLARFLADVGVPRHDRDQVPLVVAGSEIVWVAGVRPCEGRRVQAATAGRLRLVLR